MGYEKQTWSNGDVITQEKLNHMENGIANKSVLTVYSSRDQTTGKRVLSHTFAEIAPYLPFVIYGGADADPESGDECYYGFLYGSSGDYGSTYLEFVFPQTISTYTIVFRGDGLNTPMYKDEE